MKGQVKPDMSMAEEEGPNTATLAACNVKEKARIAKWKIIGQITVALMGLAGIALGAWAQVRTGGNTDALKATMKEVNDKTIPNQDKKIEDQAADIKQLTQVVINLRERLSKIEGRQEGRSMLMEYLHPARPKEKEEAKKLDKILKKPKPAPTPRIIVQQLAE